MNDKTKPDTPVLLNNYYFAEWFQKKLFGNGNQELIYLRNNGYTDDEIRKLGFGALHIENLDFQHKEALGRCGIDIQKGIGSTHTIAIPYYGYFNNDITGFLFASIDSGEELKSNNTTKYIFSNKINPLEHFFNYKDDLGRCTSVIVVSDYLDALFLRAKGIARVIACGDPEGPTQRQLSSLGSNITHYTLMFDADEKGKKATVSTIKRLDRKGIFVGVVGDFQGCYGPVEFVRKNGIEAFRKIYYNPTPGHQWLAKEITKPLKGNRDAMKSVIQKEFNEIKCNYNKKKFLEEISKITNKLSIRII